MLRHAAHIGIAIIICALYSLLFFTETVDPVNYLIVSNLVSLFLVLSFIVEIQTGKFIGKDYFKAFAIDHASLVIKRVSMFYRKYFLWKLMILPPIMLLFAGSHITGQHIMMTTLAIAQNLFTVYLFISLYDLLTLKGFERHINTLPAILAVTVIGIRNSSHPELYYLNPFGGWINLPLLGDPTLYIVPVLAILVLVALNKYYIHRYWLS